MKEAVQHLETWFKRSARSLPWRKTSDPYKIWISEVMLQQTQVVTVVGYYERFLKRFPTLESLAEAKEEEVFRLWSGLGYYSRARNLLKGAQTITQTYGGNFPRTREEILTVSGIGPYTAGAILSIAFDLPEPLVDGNVLRVLSRYLGFKDSIDLPKSKAFFWETTEAWVKWAKSPRVFNQALMELGATVCTKANPPCDRCPLQKTCYAKKHEMQALLPVRKKRRKTVELHWTLFVHEQKGKIYLRKNPLGSWWAGLWDLPREEKKIQVLGQPLNVQNHTVTHHKISAYPFLLRSKPDHKDGKWVSKKEILEWPLSSLSRKVLTSL